MKKDKISWVKLQELQEKVQYQYNLGYEYIHPIIDEKLDVKDKLFKPNEEWFVQNRLLWKNIKLERALFLTDESDVTFVTTDNILGRQISENAQLVCEYDDEDMNLIDVREEIIDDNWLYGLAITVINDWDNESKQPITRTMNPLGVIPDPMNYRGSELRFIGFQYNVSLEELKHNPAYEKAEIDKIALWLSETMERIKMRDDDDNWTNPVYDDKDTVTIVDFFTTFEWKKVLTTWDKSLNVLLRYVELEPLTEAEIKNPMKISYPIQLHRRCPKPKSFFGVSIADEVLQDQDVVTNITNYEILNARLSLLWPDKLISTDLWIDTDLLNDKKPWWRYIEVESQGATALSSKIFSDNPINPSNYSSNVKKEVQGYGEQLTWTSSLTFWVSQSGIQTKAEVQMLMQNTNTLLTYIWNNYLRWQKDYRMAHYKAYCLYMKWNSTKVISLFQKWFAKCLELKKDEFIADGKVWVTVKSRYQEQIKKDKEYSKLLSLANLYLGNMQDTYSRNKFLRKMWDKLWVSDFYAEDYIEYTVDERDAIENLKYLNQNIRVDWPEEWQDYKTYLDIYSQAINTPAKEIAMHQYTMAYNAFQRQWQMQIAQEQAMQEMWTDKSASNMAMNNLNRLQTQEEEWLPNIGWVRF